MRITRQSIIQVIKNILRGTHNFLTTFIYNKQYKRLLSRNKIPNKSVINEADWISKWAVLGKPQPEYYRLFSQYIGYNTNIVPEDICRNIIEPILDPIRYVAYYSDKNIFDKLFNKGTMPETILRKMNGFYYDAEYQYMSLSSEAVLQNILQNSDKDKIIIKPTVDSCSGNGVRLFQKKDNLWHDMSSNDILSLEYLNEKYGTNFIIQECLEQSDAMSYFNPTSVNTLRLTVYRSVKTNECHVPSAIIRIGANGSLVDNAHAGGGYVGINVKDGTLCKRVLNQYGESKTEFNGIDFTKEHQILNWDKVIEFAKYIGNCIPHHRLLALDIMVDKSRTPRLIEFHCDAYGMWPFQFTSGPAFGEYTDEIIEYCRDNIQSAEKVIRL